MSNASLAFELTAGELSESTLAAVAGWTVLVLVFAGWTVFVCIPWCFGGCGMTMPCSAPAPVTHGAGHHSATSTAEKRTQIPGAACCCCFFTAQGLGVRVPPIGDGSQNTCLTSAAAALRHQETLLPHEGGTMQRSWLGAAVGTNGQTTDERSTTLFPLCSAADVIARHAHTGLGFYLHDVDRAVQVLAVATVCCALPLLAINAIRNTTALSRACAATPSDWATTTSASSPLAFAAYAMATVGEARRDASACWTWGGNAAHLWLDLLSYALSAAVAFAPLVVFVLAAMQARVQWRNAQRRCDVPAQFTLCFRALGLNAQGTSVEPPSVAELEAAFRRWGPVAQVVVHSGIDSALVVLAARAIALGKVALTARAANGAFSTAIAARKSSANEALAKRERTLHAARAQLRLAGLRASCESAVFISYDVAADAQRCYDDLALDTQRYVLESANGGAELRCPGDTDFEVLLSGQLCCELQPAMAHGDIVWQHFSPASAFRPPLASLAMRRVCRGIRTAARIGGAAIALLAVALAISAPMTAFVLWDDPAHGRCRGFVEGASVPLAGIGGSDSAAAARVLVVAVAIGIDGFKYAFRKAVLPKLVALLRFQTRTAEQLSCMCAVFALEVLQLTFVFAATYVITAQRIHAARCADAAEHGSQAQNMELCLSFLEYRAFERFFAFVCLSQLTSTLCVVVEELLHPAVWAKRLVCFCCCRARRTRKELKLEWLAPPPELWLWHTHTCVCIFVSFVAAVAYPAAVVGGLFKLVVLCATLRLAALRTRPAPPRVGAAIYTMAKVITCVAATLAGAFNFAATIFFVRIETELNDRVLRATDGATDGATESNGAAHSDAIFALAPPLLVGAAAVIGFGVCSLRSARHAAPTRQALVCAASSAASVVCGVTPLAIVVLCLGVSGWRLDAFFYTLCFLFAAVVGVGGSAASAVAMRLCARRAEVTGTWRVDAARASCGIIAAIAVGGAALLSATIALLSASLIDFVPNVPSTAPSCDGAGKSAPALTTLVITLSSACGALFVGGAGIGLTTVVLLFSRRRLAACDEERYRRSKAAESIGAIEMAGQPAGSAKAKAQAHASFFASGTLRTGTVYDVDGELAAQHANAGGGAALPVHRDTTAAFERLVVSGALAHMPSADDVQRAWLRVRASHAKRAARPNSTGRANFKQQKIALRTGTGARSTGATDGTARERVSASEAAPSNTKQGAALERDAVIGNGTVYERLSEATLKALVVALRRNGNGGNDQGRCFVVLSMCCTPRCLFPADVTRHEWALTQVGVPLLKPTWNNVVAKWRTNVRRHAFVSSCPRIPFVAKRPPTPRLGYTVIGGPRVLRRSRSIRTSTERTRANRRVAEERRDAGLDHWAMRTCGRAATSAAARQGKGRRPPSRCTLPRARREGTVERGAAASATRDRLQHERDLGNAVGARVSS